MLRCSQILLAASLTVIVGAAASAQITLVPGAARPVSFRPRYIATADFNNDGSADAVVAGPTSRKVTILFNAKDGSFGSVLDIPIGRVLRGLATGDLNDDGNADVAVLDFLDGRIFRLTGNGDDTFNAAEPFPVGLRPVEVTIGKFDAHNGDEVATADLTGRVTVLSPEFARKIYCVPVGPCGPHLGAAPKRLRSADLNADGFDDLVATTAGSGGADHAAVLLNTGGSGFQPFVHHAVGAAAIDFSIADLNNDGALDVAVLNAGETDEPNKFSVSILLNRTEIHGGRMAGTGSFEPRPAVRVGCPADIGGSTINCVPNAIAAGDFDADGNQDLALSVSTTYQASGLVAPGLVEAFAGHGDGSFELVQVVTLADVSDLQGMVAADFNGDTVADLAVAEQGARSVRILLGLPPSRPNAAPCTAPGQCASGFCVDGICCAAPSCAGDERCDIYDAPGECAPRNPRGGGCRRDSDCTSNNCVASEPPRCACPGDCGGDGRVTNNDLLDLVRIALGGGSVAACYAGDVQHAGTIAIHAILTAVNRAVDGCGD